MRVLFVCTGNSCRSVMAERLFNAMAGRRGLSWTARSCGLAADPSFPTPDEVYRALAPKGIERFEHRPRLIDRELVDWADQALTMTRAHAREAAGLFPESKRKIATLRGRAGLRGEDIADPIGQDDADYAACRDRIEEALSALMERHEHA